MTGIRSALQQHLRAAAEAYGGEFTLPPGAAPVARSAPPPASAPTSASALPAPQPVPAAPPLAQRLVSAPAPSLPPAVDNSPEDARSKSLTALKQQALGCTRCGLHRSRDQVVFGEGPPTPRVVFLGEAPGAKENQSGRPFVGDAGQLLDRILQNAMGLARSEVYLLNTLKCQPPGNRDPAPDELAHCLPYLQQQLAILQPEVIVCLGRVAARALLATEQSVTALRGKSLAYQGIPVVVTWHPAYLLREPSRKRETWEDVKRVNRLLGRPEVPNPGSQ